MQWKFALVLQVINAQTQTVTRQKKGVDNKETLDCM